jgi:hypothetical protein
MSSSELGGGGFNPPPPPPKPSPRLTMDQWQETVRFFKDVFEDSKLAWWVKAAGLGGIVAGIAGILEVLHLGWLAVRYLGKF